MQSLYNKKHTKKFAEFVLINHAELNDKCFHYSQQRSPIFTFQGIDHFWGKRLKSFGQNCHKEIFCFVRVQQGANVRSFSNGGWYWQLRICLPCSHWLEMCHERCSRTSGNRGNSQEKWLYLPVHCQPLYIVEFSTINNHFFGIIKRTLGSFVVDFSFRHKCEYCKLRQCLTNKPWS